jgi:DNA-binding transcriptional LysR family regulator
MKPELPIGLLRTFSAVSETNSFTRAGEILHVTQSAVSMQMKRLEEVIGRSLFRKKGRSFTLTAEGELLQEHAQRILAAHNEAVAAFSQPELVGSVRFGCAEDYAARFLPRILSEFRNAFPRIRVDIRIGPGHRLHRALERNELDLCLLEGIASGGRLVRREPVVWVTSRNSTAHRMDPLPLAVYDEGCNYRHWAIDALQKNGRAYWIAFVSPSISSILAAVKAGLAVAPIGRSSLDDALRLLGPEDGFALLPVSEVSLHQAQTADSGAVSCFADYVAAAFQKVVVS